MLCFINARISLYHTNIDLNDAFAEGARYEWLEAEKQGAVIVTFASHHDALEWSTKLLSSPGEDGERPEIPITASS